MLPLIEEKKRNAERAEMTFVFAVIWAFGGALIVDKAAGIDSRRDFHEGLIGAFPAILRKSTDILRPSSTLVQRQHRYVGAVVRGRSGIQAHRYRLRAGPATVREHHGGDSRLVRITRLMSLLVEGSHNVMLVGAAGTGKTAIINHFLDHLSHENESFLYTNINMNYFSDSKALQVLLDRQLTSARDASTVRRRPRR